MSSVSAKLAAAVATNTTSPISGYEPTSDPIRQKNPQTQSVIEHMIEGKRKYNELPQSDDFRPKIAEKDQQTTTPMMKNREEMLFAFTAPNGHNPRLSGARTQY